MHRVHWDGRNQDGAPASSGVYQARVRTTDGSDQQSMVLVR
ncbi:MAG: FlgD immunoglobulin-like domain containing protein [Opitutales bacterium]